MECLTPTRPCDNCHLACNGDRKCCFLVYAEIKRFKQHVVNTYIVEVIFDMIVSIISVVLDIITLIVYAYKGKWGLAVLTALPVLLPTTVFTNVYMSDESRGYCKMPKKGRKPKLQHSRSSGSVLNRVENRIQGGKKLGIFNIVACCSGLLHFFHKDRSIRDRGKKLVRKTFRRSLKYVFGTLVLRFIAWAWYLKALIFGVKALKEPRKYMKAKQPDNHWSRELLIRLDFLQAALENAPQCVIQLYTLLTDFSENRALGLLTLAFSFIDFLRVVTSVFWNVHKGPVVAPKHCYGGLLWQLVNWISWIFLYVARCSAIALVIGSAAASGYGPVLIVPIATAIVHCVLFAKVFNLKKFGQAKKKLFVTTLISIFFLPELDTRDVKVISQVYSAMQLLENTLFIVPYRGISFSGYCFEGKGSSSINATASSSPEPLALTGSFNMFYRNGPRASNRDHRDCLIDPVIIVLMVPSLTIVGYVARMAAQSKMLRFKDAHPDKPPSTIMEERVATIYNRKWTTMNAKEMWNNFKKMIGNRDTGDVTSMEKTGETELQPQDLKSGLGETLQLTRESCYTIYKVSKPYGDICDEEKYATKPKINTFSPHTAEIDSCYNSFPLLDYSNEQLLKMGEGMILARSKTLPRATVSPCVRLPLENPTLYFLQSFEFEYLRVDAIDGPLVFEMCNI